MPNTDWLSLIPGWQIPDSNNYGLPAGARPLGFNNPFRIGVHYSTTMPSWLTRETQQRLQARIGPYLTNAGGEQVYSVPFLEGGEGPLAEGEGALQPKGPAPDEPGTAPTQAQFGIGGPQPVYMNDAEIEAQLFSGTDMSLSERRELVRGLAPGSPIGPSATPAGFSSQALYDPTGELRAAAAQRAQEANDSYTRALADWQKKAEAWRAYHGTSYAPPGTSPTTAAPAPTIQYRTSPGSNLTGDVRFQYRIPGSPYTL